MPLTVFNIKGTRFCVPDYYKVTKALGQGAYGLVAEAVDSRTNETVAIKKISNLFIHLVDSKRTLREISILRYLQHENVVKLLDILVPEDPSNFDDLYLVFDFMQTDLHKIITSKQDLSPDHIQYFMYQLLRGLKYIHSAGCVHRDLKPSNLLLNADCSLEICDLGLSRLVDPETGGHKGQDVDKQDAQMTEYVATRWYRAPEIILGDPNYSKPVDIFSVGCILAEIVCRKPLFPGRDYIHQLHLILEVLGTPAPALLDQIASESAKNYVASLKPCPPTDIAKKFFSTGPAAAFNPPGIDLVKRCLEFDPEKRITVEQCLEHPYFEGLHDSSDEPVYAGTPVTLFFEKYELSKELLEFCFLNEARKFHNDELIAEVEKRAGKLGIKRAEWDI